jgi:hypothetical protein
MAIATFVATHTVAFAQRPATTEDAALRQELSASVVQGWELELGKSFSSRWASFARHRLERLSVPQLEALDRGVTLGEVAPKALHASGDALVYFALDKPCRLVDTRQIDEPLVRNIERDFSATDPDLTDQGGQVTGCGVPFGEAVAIMANFLAVEPQGKGNIQAWPFGGLQGDSVINFAAQSELDINLINAVIIPICDASLNPPACSNDFTLKLNFAPSSDTVVTVYGYYSRLGASSGTGPVVTTASPFNDQDLEFAMYRRLVQVDAACSSSTGTFVVTAQALARIRHTVNFTDHLELCLADDPNPAACFDPGTEASYATWIVNAAQPGNNQAYTQTLHLHHVQEVTDCDEEQSFYLNGVMQEVSVTGDEILAFFFNQDTKVTAVFYPD